MQQIKRTSDEAINFSSSLSWRWPKFFLSLFGAWPLQSPTNRYVLSSTTSILLASMLIPEILKLIRIRKNIEEVLLVLPFLSTHITAVIIIVNLFANFQTLKILVLRVRRDWRSVIFESEKKLIQIEQHDHENILLILIFNMGFVTSMYLIVPLLPILFDQIKPLNESRPRIIVLHVEYFLDEEKYYGPMMIHSSIFTSLTASAIIAFDVIFATSTHHACSIFKIVGQRLQLSINDMQRKEPRMEILVVQTELRRALGESIRLHRDILQFVDLLQAAFSSSLFIMNIISMMNLSMTAYQAVNTSNNSGDIVKLGFYATGQLIRLYFRSWHGQMLINSSESVFDSVYQADWYDMPSELRACIILILVRGKKQSRITAGKLFDMSMDNFAFVVRTAISYFTVLRSMQ